MKKFSIKESVGRYLREEAMSLEDSFRVAVKLAGQFAKFIDLRSVRVYKNTGELYVKFAMKVPRTNAEQSEGQLEKEIRSQANLGPTALVNVNVEDKGRGFAVNYSMMVEDPKIK